MEAHRSDIFARVFNGKAFLAPMLGTTDIPFRAMCREFSAGLTFTEMVSAKGITSGKRDSFRNAVFEPSEQPIAIQLAPATAEGAHAAVRELLPLGPIAFDINCGCPNQGVCEAGAGASLLDNLPLMHQIIAAAAVAASPIPVSAKVRMHGNSRASNTHAIARVAEDAGAAWITIHGRGRQTPYNLPANWEAIAEAKLAVSIPVIGNGDVFSARDAYALMERTGCDAVMIGRGALGTPWIFRDIAEGRRTGLFDDVPSNEELAHLIRRHGELLLREYGPFSGLPRFQKHALWYLRQHAEAEGLQHQIFHEEDFLAIFRLIEAFLSGHPARNEPGSKRFEEVERRFRTRVLYWTVPQATSIP